MTAIRSLDPATLPLAPARFQPVICLPLLLSTGVALMSLVPVVVDLTCSTSPALSPASALQVSTLSYGWRPVVRVKARAQLPLVVDARRRSPLRWRRCAGGGAGVRS